MLVLTNITKMNKLKKIFITLIACGFAIAHTSVLPLSLKSHESSTKTVELGTQVHHGVLDNGVEVFWQCEKRMNGPVKIALKAGDQVLAFEIICGETI